MEQIKSMRDLRSARLAPTTNKNKKLNQPGRNDKMKDKIKKKTNIDKLSTRKKPRQSRGLSTDARAKAQTQHDKLQR